MAMKLKEIIFKNAEKLKTAGIPNAYKESEFLLLLALNRSQAWLYVNKNLKLSFKKRKKINYFVKKRLQGLPLAYIAGYQEFYGIKFFVNKNVLIPRPETELIVEEVLKKAKKNTPNCIVDIGTGSGAIIVSLAKKIKKPKIKFWGTDISAKALYVARKNAGFAGVNQKITFSKGDLLKPIFQKTFFNRCLQKENSYLIITANLPYLSFQEYKAEKSIAFEPSLALVAGKDGLKIYKDFFKQAEKLKKIFKNKKITLIIEFNPSQTNKLKKIIIKRLPLAKLEIKKDLAGLKRLMVINF